MRRPVSIIVGTLALGILFAGTVSYSSGQPQGSHAKGVQLPKESRSGQSWHLEDVTQTARENPKTFFIPDAAERSTLQSGQRVRLHFVIGTPKPDGPRAERMWVEISNRSDGPQGVEYAGHLTNQPAAIVDLRRGDLVEFGPRHVAQVQVRKGDPKWLPNAELKALVSTAALEDGANARFAYREKPDNREDSGWRLFRGDESEEFVNDPANVRPCLVGWLVDRDPSLRALFKNEDHAGYDRMPDGAWNRAKDWKPADQ